MVLVGQRTLEQFGKDRGFESTFDPEDEHYPLKVTFGEKQGGMRLSSHVLARIGMECVSPEWLVNSSIESFLRNAEKMTAELAGGVPPEFKDMEMNALFERYALEAGFAPDERIVVSTGTKKA